MCDVRLVYVKTREVIQSSISHGIQVQADKLCCIAVFFFSTNTPILHSSFTASVLHCIACSHEGLDVQFVYYVTYVHCMHGLFNACL